MTNPWKPPCTRSFRAGWLVTTRSPRLGSRLSVQCMCKRQALWLFLSSRYHRDAMPCDDLLALDTSECRQLVSRSQSSWRRLHCLFEVFNGLTHVFAWKAMVALSNQYTVANMYGLGTLPNELLIRIFEFVVFADQTLPNRWRAAVPLSHVCRYFRRTVLSCPLLWSDISGNADMASLSLTRSKDVLLDVTVALRVRSTWYCRTGN